MHSSNRPEVDRSTRFYYGIGSAAFGIKDAGFGALLLLYYNQVLGLPAEKAGLATMIALVADSFVDPVIGRFSDGLITRWGRRHPLMYIASIGASLSYLLIWIPPQGLSEDELFFYLIGVAIVARTFIALYEIPSSCLIAEFTNDYDLRTALQAHRYFFAWLGGVGITLLAYNVFLKATPEFPAGQLNPEGYRHYGIAAAFSMFMCILISTAGTHRFIPYLPKAPPKSPFNFRKTVAEMWETVATRPFVILLLGTIVGFAGTGLTRALDIYLHTYFWGLSTPQISILIVAYFFAAWISLILAPHVSVWVGKKMGTMLMLILVICVAPIPIVARLLGLAPENGSDELLAILFVHTGVLTTLVITSGILKNAMMAEVIEHSELETGRRSEGVFFSVNSLTIKAVGGLGIGISGYLLSIVGFPEGATPGNVQQVILNELALGYLAILIAIQILSFWIISRFPITREVHLANLARLQARASN